MFSIGITVPFHLRGGTGFAIKPVFSYLSKLPYTVVLCGSEGKKSFEFSRPFLNETTHYAEVPQKEICVHAGGSQELREKYNGSILALRKHGIFDWFCTNGANDYVDRVFWETLSKTDPARTIAMLHPQSPIYFITKGAAVRLPPQGNIPGPVFAFSRDTLEEVNYRPYVREFDECGVKNLGEELGWKLLLIEATYIAFKGDRDLNKFEYFKKKVVPITDDEKANLEWAIEAIKSS